MLLVSRKTRNRNMLVLLSAVQGSLRRGAAEVARPPTIGSRAGQAHGRSAGEEKLSSGFSIMVKILPRRFRDPVSRGLCGSGRC
jgi:hypothetical protein